ncbi:unnamed protein product [Heterosigma akashiwo]
MSGRTFMSAQTSQTKSWAYHMLHCAGDICTFASIVYLLWFIMAKGQFPHKFKFLMGTVHEFLEGQPIMDTMLVFCGGCSASASTCSSPPPAEMAAPYRKKKMPEQEEKPFMMSQSPAIFWGILLGHVANC